jgi:hypothetical protein
LSRRNARCIARYGAAAYAGTSGWLRRRTLTIALSTAGGGWKQPDGRTRTIASSHHGDHPADRSVDGRGAVRFSAQPRWRRQPAGAGADLDHQVDMADAGGGDHLGRERAAQEV